MYNWIVLGFKNLWANRFRNILTLFGIILSVALILAIQITNNSIDKSIKSKVDEMYGNADIIVSVPERSNSIISTEEINTLLTMKGIKEIVPSLDGKLTGPEQSLFNVTGVNIEKSRQIQGFDLVAGSWFTSNHQYEMIISSKYARENNLEIGALLSYLMISIIMILLLQALYLSLVQANN